MSRPYNIPRNYKGENKILYIFSTKAFIYTGVGVFLGWIFYFLFKLVKLNKVGIIIMITLGVIGFVLGTFKMPESNKFELTKKTGGEPLDQIILRWIKFKRKKKRIYIYREKKEVNENVK